MKMMNYLVVITIMLLGLACSEEELPEENLIATNFSYSLVQETKYLNGLELYKIGAMQSLSLVKEEIYKLKEAIDINRGSKGLVPKLEAAQNKESVLNEFKSGLVSINKPKGSKWPPRPPRGCFDNPQSDCIPKKLNITGYSGIELTDGLDKAEVEIRQDGKLVAKGGEVRLNRDGNMVMDIKGNFTGDAIMFIKTLKSRTLGQELVIEVPVYKN